MKTTTGSLRLATLTIGMLLLLAAPAAADTRIEREFDLGGGGKFLLDTDSGSVEVTGTAGNQVRVVITSRRDDIESLYDVKFEQDTGSVRVSVDRKGKKSWFNWGSGGGLKFAIEVPRDTVLDIDTSGGSIEIESVQRECRLDTSGGSIHASDIGGQVDADTSGGSIKIDKVRGDVVADTSGGSIEVADVTGSVRADTSGGSIRIDEVTGDIEADTSGGSIQINGAGGRVEADTSGGPVRVTFSPGNAGGGSLSSSGGGVTVWLDPAVDLTIDASSSGGSVTSDLELVVKGRISRTNLQGRLGAGGETLRLRSSGGGIKIQPN